MKLTGRWVMRAVLVLALAALVAPPAVLGQEVKQDVITIPAVSFTDQGGGDVSRDEPRRSAAMPEAGFIHFWYTPDHWLQWPVDAAAPGEYEVTVRYASRFSVQRRLTVNGRTVEKLESFTLPHTGGGEQKRGWSKWSEVKLPAPVTLEPGQNTLRMTCLDDLSVCLSEVVLTAPGKPEVTIPAARFADQGGGQVQVITPPVLGTVGGVWRQAWHEAGHWLQWTAEIPRAGRYAVGFHYRADGYCRLELQVNGEKVEGLDSFILPKTGALNYFTVGTLPVPVTLTAGKNTLRVTVLGGESRSTPRFDGMFSLSAIHLRPLAEGQALGDDVLKLSTVEELTRAATVEERQDTPKAPLGPALPEVPGAITLAEGTSFDLAGRAATVTTADVLPYADNQFTRGCVWDSYDSPQLKELREKFKLDEVVAPGKDEYEKQKLLMTWVWQQWDHGHAQEYYNLRDPVLILSEARKEHIFQCMHSGSTLASVMASMGWICRAAGHSTHTWNEVWSNQHRRWMFFDPTANLRYERKGVPQSSYDVYHARYVEEADDVTAFSRLDSQYAAPARPDRTARISIYGCNVYINGRPKGPRARLEIGKDLTMAFDPKEAYYPLNQAAMALVPDDDALKVTLGTMTPNFKEFRVRIDGGQWRPSEATFAWPLRAGKNRLEAVSVNRFGVEGPVSSVVINVGE